MRSRTLLASMAVLALIAAPLAAQPLADQVPDDAMVYFGWKGAKSLGPAYEQSRLKAVLDSCKIDELFNEFLPQLKQLAQRQPDIAQVMTLVSAIGPAMWNHPTAFYFGGVEFAPGAPPAPKLAVLCEAGDDSKALLDAANKVIAMIPQPPFDVSATQRGNAVLINVGPTPLLKKAPMPPLSNAPRFKAAMKHVGKDPVYTFYVDSPAVVKLVDQVIKAMPEQAEVAKTWPKVREALGVDGVGAMIFAGGFDGKDWMDHGFVEAPAPRKGLTATLLDPKPVSDQMLQLVPQSATMMMAGRMDLSALFSAIREMVGKIDPDAQAQMDAGLKQLAEMLGGLELNKDILATLGPEWVIYSSPEVTGNGLLGLVLVNRLTDAAKAEKALTQLEELANQAMAANFDGRSNPKISFKKTQADGLTIHYLGIPVVAPAWTIKNGKLYVALYPQVVAGAASLDVAGGRKATSILNNEAYQAVMQRVNAGGPARSVSFADLPKTAPDAYQLVLLISRTYLGIADMFGLQSPAMLVPPIGKILPHLAPAGGATWIDDGGWHMRSVVPFPGAAIFGGQLGAAGNAPAAVAPLAVSIMLPALSSARERANRVKCAANLRSIGQGCIIYANDNKGKFPPDLGVLVTSADLSPHMVVCPSGNHAVPQDLVGRGDEKLLARQAAWVNANSDYVYLGAGQNMDKVKADQVLAYEKPGAHSKQGVNVLFGDCHVEWVTNEQLQKLLNPAPADGRL